MKSIYMTNEYYGYHPTFFQEDSPWKVMKTINILSELNIELTNNPFNIVEVGCGAGLCLKGVSDYFAKKNNQRVNAFGFDLSSKAIELAKKNYPSGHFENKQFDPEDFDKNIDILLLYDFLEHIEEPSEFIRKVKTYSCLIIAHIPLDDNYNLKIRDPKNKNVFITGHVNRFNKVSATKLFIENNFKVLAQELLSIDVDGTTKRPGVFAFFGRPIKKILYMLSKDLLAITMGCSLLLVAKKND